ncbi:HD-GYP domain-containing protein [Paenibacillus sp. y28]|uniref:HD-GYP domain-containing protein n=1 Tax=Paenibacillus sp. y28 TaxID=3129110 RepID=UPI003018307E
MIVNEEPNEQLLHEPERTYIELIHRMGRAAEYRDPESSGHIERIGRFCMEMAFAAGMEPEDARRIYYASSLHDVGKIGIPDRILLKPGPLTAKEWNIMKTHTTIGAQILSGSTSRMIQMAEQIALTHHEKWDGSGYPFGLSGQHIPLTGRLTAICDVYDALTSERPYKRAWSEEEALREMARGRESHFDPELLDLFFDLYPRLLALKQRAGQGARNESAVESEQVEPGAEAASEPAW